MVTTNNKTLYDRLCLLRTHGITKDPAYLCEKSWWLVLRNGSWAF